VARFTCLDCRRTFSSARFFPCFRQKKRTLNTLIRRYLGSNISQRRLALTLGVHRNTVVRKFLFLGRQADQALDEFQRELASHEQKIEEIQFDEMQSYERSKCLPLSIPLVVDAKRRKILAFRVCSMPAGGPLAEISRRKYGPRKDERAVAVRSLLEEIKPLLAPNVKVTTDQEPHYPGWIRAAISDARHVTVKGRRGCIVGQGELKKIGFDPLFSLNHTAAMLRANINRLARRTWCTTKKGERLRAHIALYAQIHNEILTA
jgi:hypothetical protein